MAKTIRIDDDAYNLLLLQKNKMKMNGKEGTSFSDAVREIAIKSPSSRKRENTA